MNEITGAALYSTVGDRTRLFSPLVCSMLLHEVDKPLLIPFSLQQHIRFSATPYSAHSKHSTNQHAHQQRHCDLVTTVRRCESVSAQCSVIQIERDTHVSHSEPQSIHTWLSTGASFLPAGHILIVGKPSILTCGSSLASAFTCKPTESAT